MTPLEELQAAHKRLSELREYTGASDWYVKPSPVSAVKVMNKASDEIAYVAGGMDANLIVTLHRTIDAQLAILSNAIGYHRSWLASLRDVELLPLEVNLARAINEEAS